MAISINSNTPSIAANQMGKTQKMLENTLSKLASGRKINAAKDNAAGLAIMTEMDAQMRSFSQAQRNTMDGVSMVQTAEGAMSEMSDAVIRMRELTLQAGNGALSDDDRAAIDAEISSLMTEVDRIAGTTEFNGQRLLDGSAGEVNFQVGANAETENRIAADLSTPVDSANLGAGEGAPLNTVSAATAETALASLNAIDAAMRDISSRRSDLGTTQNELATQQRTLAQARVSYAESRSRIADTDFAETSTQLARDQIMMQSSAAVIAQANQIPAMALSLVG